MKKRIVSVFAALLLLAGIAAGCGKEPEEPNKPTAEYLSVVKDGQTDYQILLPGDATDALLFAAEELTEFFERCFSVSLTATDQTAAGGKYLSLGETALGKAKISEPGLPAEADGFVIRFVGEDVFILGKTDRGVLYGCYEFLERYAGVRFVTRDCTYVPEQRSLSVEKTDVSVSPRFAQRNFLFWDNIVDKKFAARTRQFSNQSGSKEQYGHKTDWCLEIGDIHNSLNYVPKSKYEATHPEFYASYTNPAGTRKYDDLCYTNGITDEGELDAEREESVAKIVIETIERYAEADEDATFFMIGINDDTTSYCKCGRCEASNQKYGTRSGTMCVFMNVVADEVNRWARETNLGREINIVFFAYYWTVDPPVKEVEGKYVPYHEKVVLGDNCYVRYAPLPANYAYGFADEKQYQIYPQIIEGWHTVTKHLMIFDYVAQCANYLWYIPNLSYLKANAQYLADNDFYYWFAESNYDTDGVWQQKLLQYIWNELCWDADVDVSAVTDEFLRLYNGEVAAPFVAEYLAVMEEHYAKLKTGSAYHFGIVETTAFKYTDWPIELLESCETLLKRAQAAVETAPSYSEEEKSLYGKRLSEVLLHVQFMTLYNYDSYYIGGKQEYAAEFFANCAKCELSRVGEDKSVAWFKKVIGYKE